MYLIGKCFLELGDYRAAADQFARTHSLYPNTPEGAAGCFQLAEIYRRMGRDVESLIEYRRAANEVIGPEGYNNPWISLDQLRGAYLAAYQHYLAAQKFEITLQLTRIMHPLFPVDQVLSLQAETHGVWGQTLMAQADKGPRNKAESIRSMAREQFRKAGTCYAKLVKILPANQKFSDQVWNGAMAYMQGKDFKNAARMFQIYLKNEVQRRRPQALTYLGESLLALDQLDKALEMFKECIELHPRDIAACRARLLAARAYEEKGDRRRAESLLLENLNGDYLTPTSKEWRDSLFTLGELLHADRRYAEAARRLEEAVNRYTDLPEAVQARYLLADCHRQMALAAQGKPDKDLTDDFRIAQSKQLQELLSQALEQYKQVREGLGNYDNADMSPSQQAILRNSYFAMGDVLFAQGKYEEAIKACYAAANRYQSCPEALNAYVQIANAYKRLNKPLDAQSALQQAKFTLKRIKPDVG